MTDPTVIPAKARIQRLCNLLKALDSCFCVKDDEKVGKAVFHTRPPHGTHRAALPHIYGMGS